MCIKICIKTIIRFVFLTVLHLHVNCIKKLRLPKVSKTNVVCMLTAIMQSVITIGSHSHVYAFMSIPLCVFY